MFAIFAAILANISVNTIHRTNGNTSGSPPIAKCDTEPVSAVNVIINTLVPTAVFSSYPITLVRRSNIIIPPPAPINPQINPTTAPHITDFTIRDFADTTAISSLVVITGFTMNLIPSISVMNTEKFPIATDGTRLDI